MKIYNSIAELHGYLDSKVSASISVGLVPTMGALHDGHAKLVESSIKTCDLTICSIFVNPTQFNNQEDLLKYPKQLDADKKILEAVGCDVIFAPSVEEMYPTDEKVISLHFGALEGVLEGAFRPGHFSGVGVVVSKLLNIVQPNFAFFGQKDLQQLAIIKKLVKDLNIRTKIVSVATVRELSGLAMSSRNLRLTEDERVIAAHLYRVMEALKNEVLIGTSISEAVSFSRSELDNLEGVELEYLEVVDSDTMMKLDEINATSNASICLAAHVGQVRLIDNLYVKQEV